jgi:valyl-tRNA synthetase
MAVLQAVISAARTIRSEHDLTRHDVPLTLRTSDEVTTALLRREIIAIRTLVRTAGDPVIEPRGLARPRGAVMSIAADVEVLVQLRGLVEGTKETLRIEREIKRVDKDVAALEKKLTLPSFADKAPPEVVAEAHAQLGELQRKRHALVDARAIATELDDA